MKRYPSAPHYLHGHCAFYLPAGWVCSSPRENILCSRDLQVLLQNRSSSGTCTLNLAYGNLIKNTLSLKQFSFDIAEEASKVCLAHLFTYQDFDMGTLGLAYVGSPRANSHGGVCPKGTSYLHCRDTERDEGDRRWLCFRGDCFLFFFL